MGETREAPASERTETGAEEQRFFTGIVHRQVPESQLAVFTEEKPAKSVAHRLPDWTVLLERPEHDVEDEDWPAAAEMGLPRKQTLGEML